MSRKQKLAELEEYAKNLEQEYLAAYEAEQKKKREAENMKRKMRYHASKKGPTFSVYTKTGLLQRNSKPSRTPKGQETNSEKDNPGASAGTDLLTISQAGDPDSVPEMVEETIILVDEPVTKRHCPTSDEHREKRALKWEDLRPRIFASMQKEESPMNGSRAQCAVCNNNSAVIRCSDGCGDVCIACDARQHKFLATHLRQTWVFGHRIPLHPCQTVERRGGGSYVQGNDDRAIPVRMDKVCRACGSGDVKEIIGIPCVFVSLRGRYDVFLPALACQSQTCSSITTVEVEDLISSNYFPASPSIHDGCYIYDVEVLRTFHHLKMASPDTSAISFRTSLERKSTMFVVNETKICPASFSDALEEWARCIGSMT